MVAKTDLLTIGCAVGDITPVQPIPLAGFAFRKGPFETIAHRLKLRVAIFRGSDGTVSLLVVADLLWWDPVFVDHCRDLILDRFGIPRAAQIFSATHTHSAPAGGSTFAATLGEADESYLKMLETQLLLLVRRAGEDAEPIQMCSRGSSTCDIGINRRRQTVKGISMAPNPNGSVDREVVTVDFLRTDGTVKMTLCHFGCHPTVKADLSISSEYCGVAMDALEQITDAPAFFLLGCCAEVKPDLQRDGAFLRGGVPEVEMFAERFLSAILKARREAQTSKIEGFVEYRSLEIELGFQRRYSKRLLSRVADGHLEGVPAYFQSLPIESVQAWAKAMRENDARLPKLEVTLVSVAKGVTLLAMSGEMASDYGAFAKHISGDVLPVTCCNGMAGYIPTEEFIREGGYEGGDVHILFLYPNAFRRGLESRIKRSLLKIVNKG